MPGSLQSQQVHIHQKLTRVDRTQSWEDSYLAEADRAEHVQEVEEGDLGLKGAGPDEELLGRLHPLGKDVLLIVTKAALLLLQHLLGHLLLLEEVD